MLNKLLKTSISSLVLITLLACSAKVQPVVPAETSQVTGQQLSFVNTRLAVDALKQAVKNADSVKLAQIFGPESKDLLNSGDPVVDKDSIRDFAMALSEKVRVVELKNTDPKVPAKEIAWLEVGKGNWPFPVPLLKEKNLWIFDTANGKQEIINRRVGENEFNVIRFAKEYVIAQLEYYALDRDADGTSEFATKIISTPGKKDGLYWTAVEGEALSPIGPLVANASLDGYATTPGAAVRPFHGYYFRILSSQTKNARGGAMNYVRSGKMTEGFALIASPAQWDNSGAMTFMVGPDGVLYKKNLGPDTARLVNKITSFDPDLSWDPV